MKIIKKWNVSFVYIHIYLHIWLTLKKGDTISVQNNNFWCVQCFMYLYFYLPSQHVIFKQKDVCKRVALYWSFWLKGLPLYFFQTGLISKQKKNTNKYFQTMSFVQKPITNLIYEKLNIVFYKLLIYFLSQYTKYLIVKIQYKSSVMNRYH